MSEREEQKICDQDSAHSNLMFTNGEAFMTTDSARHQRGFWKKFSLQGFRLGTYNIKMDELIGK